jgi:KGK domain
MENQVEILGDNDVVSTQSYWITNATTYMVEEFIEAVRDNLTIRGETCDETWLAREGECRVLRVGGTQGWRQGQLRVRIKVILEFEPEDLPEPESDQVSSEAESPLDRLRA